MANSSRSLSSIGKKILIAITGMGLMLFLLGHVAGNLLVFVGSDTFNAYGHALTSNPYLLDVIELGLLGIFLIHLFNTSRNWLQNRGARGADGYQVKTWAEGKSRKTLSSTTMIVSGVIILAFIIWHVAVMKYGVGFVMNHNAEGVRDLAGQLHEVFANPLTVILYEVVMLLIGMHLWHGFSSAFQSVGVNRPGLAKCIQVTGWIFACVVGGGFFSIPPAIFLGLI